MKSITVEVSESDYERLKLMSSFYKETVQQFVSRAVDVRIASAERRFIRRNSLDYPYA